MRLIKTEWLVSDIQQLSESLRNFRGYEALLTEEDKLGRISFIDGISGSYYERYDPVQIVGVEDCYTGVIVQMRITFLDTSRLYRVDCQLMRLQNGKLHSKTGPAQLNRTYLLDLAGSSRIGGSLEKLYFINNVRGSERAFKLALEANSNLEKKTRIKLYGNVQLGEELQVYGDGSIVWLQNGNELWVLAPQHRTKGFMTRKINEKLLEMGIDAAKEKGKTFFETDPFVLEEMYVDTSVALLRSITPE